MYKYIHRNIGLQIDENWMFKAERQAFFAVVTIFCQLVAFKSQPFEVKIRQVM